MEKFIYKDYVKFLKDNSENEYREFHKKICNTNYEILGIRVPRQRAIAKEVFKKYDIDEFFSKIKDNYYEEVLIEGLVISLIKDEEKFYKYFINYIKKIDCWAICDTFCSSLKIIDKYDDKYFDIALLLSLDSEEYVSRVGLIMILNHFIKNKNLKKIFDLLNKINSDKYYINMAEAWLVCELYIRYPQEVLKFILNNKLNNFTFNKAIDKINDSYRVEKKDKEYLKTLKRK